MPNMSKNPFAEPIRLKLCFDSLHANKDGSVTLKFELPPAECGKAGLFPVMRDIIFDAVFTPEDVKVVSKRKTKL